MPRHLATSLPKKAVVREVCEEKSLLVRNLPNAITCVTVACGFLLMMSTSIPGMSPYMCVLATGLGLVADVMDGTVARRLQVKSKFGGTFDQLADLCCFGIGPAIFFTRQQQQHSNVSAWGGALSLLAGYAYMVCSVFRIARELIVHDGARPLYFVGVPTNLACTLVVSASAFTPGHPLLPWLVIALSALMVSPLHIPKGLGIFKVTEETCEPVCGKSPKRNKEKMEE